MEQEEHQRQHAAEGHESAKHQLRHPVKEIETTTSASHEESTVMLAYKRGIDDKTDENVGAMPAMAEGRDEESKRKSSTTSTSIAYRDDRDYHHCPSMVFTKSTDTQDNELSPVGSVSGSTPFTRKGPEALVQWLEEEARIVFVPQEQQQKSTSERDEISLSYAGVDPQALSEVLVYPTVMHEESLLPLMEREHVTEQEVPSPPSNTDVISISPEAIDGVFVPREKEQVVSHEQEEAIEPKPDYDDTSLSAHDMLPKETAISVVVPQESEELSCINLSNWSNRSSPGAYHEGGNRCVSMGSSHSRSDSSTMFSPNEMIDEPVPIMAQLVDEDMLRLQAESDAEEALHRLMDQAVQGQVIAIGNDGELDGQMDTSNKRMKEQPRKMYRRCLTLAFILICVLVVTVVMLTQPDDDQQPEPVVPEIKATWMQIGPDIDGEQENESWGSSVALSANATMLAGGKPMLVPCCQI
jgi:hypothetical protein